MFVSFIRVSVVLTALLLSAGCAEPLTLASKSAAVPAGVSLAGNWTLRTESKTPRETGSTPTVEELQRSTSGRRSGRRSRSQRNDESSAHVFIEYGEALKITQTYYSLFISYDRSVVEEFTFGENRLESLGPIEAQRVSGWESDMFVVESLDDERYILREAWSLQEDGQVLQREISLTRDEEISFERTIFYDRED